MSEENLEKRAKDMGWTSREDYKGDPDRFVDAETYVTRAETVMPILKKTNENLRGELTTVRTELNSVKSALAESKAAMKDFADFQSQITEDRVKAAKASLTRELVAAKREGNVEDEIRLQDEISLLNSKAQAAAEERAAKRVEPKAPPEPKGHDDPVFQAWIGENPWYLQDTEKRQITQGIALAIRSTPETANLVGRPFLDLVKQRVEKVFGTNGGEGSVDRVEGGRGTSQYGGGNGRSYADLPADAKAQVAKDAPKFVGENKLFKDMKGWQEHYAKQYFAGE